MTAITEAAPAVSWAEANHRYLLLELRRLRLLLQRRVLWLRERCAHDPLQAYQGMLVSDVEADALLAEDGADAEQRFYRDDPEAHAIGTVLAELERSLAAEAARLAAAGPPAALDTLARLFGLSPFERDVVLLCLAPEMDAAFERLYVYVQCDATRKHPTSALALALFARPGDSGAWLAARRSLGPTGQLRRFQIVTAEAAAPLTAASQPLRLAERITAYLLGHNQIDDHAAEVLRPVDPGLLAPGQAELLDRLYGAIDGERHQVPWPLVNLVGPADAGKPALAHALCERLGLGLLALDGIRYAQRRPPLRLLEREAVLAQVALYLDLAHLDPAQERDARAALQEAMERLGVFLLVASVDPVQIEQRTTLPARVPRPTPSEQRMLWHRALARIPFADGDTVGELVHQFDFGPVEITRSVAAAALGARLMGANGNGGGSDRGAPRIREALWRACREQSGWRLDELAQRITPGATWDDIVLPADVLAQLRELAGQVSQRPRVYEAWGFDVLLTRGRGITALFAGPSGTGKTMAAEVLANELGLDLFRVDLSGVVSKYIGETEKNLRRLFDAAEQSGAILFFDEADALFGKRSEVKDSHDRYANIEVNYLLQRMESYRGLAILATNMKSMLDQAFLRRLRFLVDFPFPDVGLRRRIWERAFPAQAEVEGIDYAAVSRLEVTGGNIRNIALNAAFLAAGEARPITMDQVVRAARREYAKIEKLVTEGEFGAYFALVRQ